MNSDASPGGGACYRRSTGNAWEGTEQWKLTGGVWKLVRDVRVNSSWWVGGPVRFDVPNLAHSGLSQNAADAETQGVRLVFCLTPTKGDNVRCYMSANLLRLGHALLWFSITPNPSEVLPASLTGVLSVFGPSKVAGLEAPVN